MILASKITEERKKLHMSQEELADKLGVSRQAVSKWESAQSIPDLQKIISMSELFSVSTDYLLKDEIESDARTAMPDTDAGTPLRKVSLEEANDFMASRKDRSRRVAMGAFLCILSPIVLIIMAGLSDSGLYGITDYVAAAVGLCFLFVVVALAVFIFIQCGMKNERFLYLEKEEFETAYGVNGLVNEKKNAFKGTFSTFLSLGIVLCVLSPLPLLIGSLLDGSNMTTLILTDVFLLIVGIGAYIVIRVCVIMFGYNILLQEGDYVKEEKRANKDTSGVGGIYWSLSTALFLILSFLTDSWDKTWIVWVIAGVLFAPVNSIAKKCMKNKQDK